MTTLLTQRITEIKENFNDLPKLEQIYFTICADFGLISDEMINSLKENQSVKVELKKRDFSSMAEYTREYEISDQYIYLKSCKYQLEALGRLMSGLKVRIESLKSESRGQY